jgi:hypothetical protein
MGGLFGSFADDEVGGDHLSLRNTIIAVEALEQSYDSMLANLYAMLLHSRKHREGVAAKRRIGESTDSEVLRDMQS